MRKATRALIFILALAPAVSGAVSPEAVYRNNEALQMLAKENHFQAYRTLLKALEADPLNPVIQYNLGVAFLANEEFDRALKQFELSDKLSKDPGVQYLSRFAAGIAATQLKQIDRALLNYQAALELQPDSEEVKKNIELLWQASGQGGEGGESDQKGDQEQNEGQGGEGQQDSEQDKGQGEQEQQSQQQKQKKPQPFKSKELTKDQVRKILEELKAQEQKIRAQEYGEGGKDAPREKDW